MEQLALDLLMGFAIGLSLGMLGGGGSILTVPALVYLVGQSPQSAVTTSLAIVGANSAMGAFFHNREGTCNWKVALVFGGAGMVTAYLSAGLSRLFSSSMLMVLFALLMLFIGLLMLWRKETGSGEDTCVHRGWPAALLGGAGVGLLTGMLGVGGGFLIVPALVMFVGLPMSQAVGTSLIIIAANSLAGLAGHMETPGFDLALTLTFLTGGFAGTFTGSRLVKHISAIRLRQVFAGFVILLALFLLYDNLPDLSIFM